MSSNGRRRSARTSRACTATLLSVLLVLANLAGVSAATSSEGLESVRKQQGAPTGLRIVGSAGETPPVVNEGGRIRLSVVDEAGVEVPVERWSSDSPEVARVTGRGLMKGRLFGYATIAATTSRGEVSASAIVVRVAPSAGNGSRGDTEPDATGAVYLSSPDDHVVWRSTGVRDRLFVGRRHVPGFVEGVGKEARLHSPSGLSFDARQGGGLLVADAENHVIRLVRPEGATSTIIGEPMTAGRLEALDAPTSEIRLDGPRGVVVLSGDLVVADTNNHQLLYVDRSRGLVSRLAGVPGESGFVEGPGLGARFNFPTGIAASPDGRLLAVADPGNDRVRLVRLMRAADGRVEAIVSTAGVASSRKARGTGAPFRQPESVAFDPIGNLYVIDADGASVLTNLGLPTETRSLLAQPGTFRDAASVAVRGARAVVLDAAAVNRRRALLSVTVGPPKIDALSRTSDSVAGGATVTIEGANFSPDSVVTLGDARVEALEVESARRLTFVVPRQGTHGARTLSVRTRGGLAQREFEIVPTSFASIEPGTLGTVGGAFFNPSGDGGSATGPGVDFSAGAVTTDAGGSVLLGDAARIRRVDASSGIITTVAGTGVVGFSGDGGPAVLAQMSGIAGLATDSSGAIFVSDVSTHRIRRVDALLGTISTIAGTGVPGFAGDGGPASEAQLDSPGGLAVDSDGGLFVADTVNNRIRRIDLVTGIITTVAGNGSSDLPVDGEPALESGFSLPGYIAVDGANRLYSTTHQGVVLRVDLHTGLTTRFAGTGEFRGSAEEGMRAVDASLGPAGLAVLPDGGVLLCDGLHFTVWRIGADRGVLERFAGNGSDSQPDDDNGDGGPARRAALLPAQVAADGLGGVFINDAGGGNRVCGVAPESGHLETIARAVQPQILPGRFATREVLATEPAMSVDGEFYVGSGHYVLRWSIEDPVLRIAAGSGSEFDEGDGGPAIEAGLGLVHEVIADPRGGFAIVTNYGARIRHVDPNGTIRTIAGTGELGNDGDGGPATEARIECFRPTMDTSGALYFLQVEDATSGRASRIKRVDPETGRIEDYAGAEIRGGPLGDGGDALAASVGVSYMRVAPNGDVYIADGAHQRIRRIDHVTRIITTVAGNGEAGTADTVHDGAPAIATPISVGQGMAFDRADRLVMITRINDSVLGQLAYRVIRVENGVLDVLSEHVQGLSVDGSPLVSARFRHPVLVGVLHDGSLVYFDQGVLRVSRGPVP